jgi:serine/threonine protein kinase
MNNYPDFSSFGYQVEQELGNNRSGGRVTYQGNNLETGQTVVIKQFQFAQSGSNWDAFKAVEQEIKILKRLTHRFIPRYLDDFKTPDGFCLVQEYKPALPLSCRISCRSFTLEEVKQIAIAVLDILVYLQKRTPPVIHRDLKPDNILVEDQYPLRVYLVDFGFARFGGNDVGVSSVVKGTLGFMPPEQIRNRELTSASDLYSLGVTLLCLLTRTQSKDIDQLIDETNQVNFKNLPSDLNPQFLKWLKKMTIPKLSERFESAEIALKELQKIPVTGKLKYTTITILKSITALFSVGCVTVAGIAVINFNSKTNIQRLTNASPSPPSPNVTPNITISEVTSSPTYPTKSEATVNNSQHDQSFNQAIKSASLAAGLVQTAKDPADWQLVVNTWKSAIINLEQVPNSDRNYDLAQEKILAYKKNLAYAEQRKLTAPINLSQSSQIVAKIQRPYDPKKGYESSISYTAYQESYKITPKDGTFSLNIQKSFSSKYDKNTRKYIKSLRQVQVNIVAEKLAQGRRENTMIALTTFYGKPLQKGTYQGLGSYYSYNNEALEKPSFYISGSSLGCGQYSDITVHDILYRVNTIYDNNTGKNYQQVTDEIEYIDLSFKQYCYNDKSILGRIKINTNEVKVIRNDY